MHIIYGCIYIFIQYFYIKWCHPKEMKTSHRDEKKVEWTLKCRGKLSLKLHAREYSDFIQSFAHSWYICMCENNLKAKIDDARSRWKPQIIIENPAWYLFIIHHCTIAISFNIIFVSLRHYYHKERFIMYAERYDSEKLLHTTRAWLVPYFVMIAELNMMAWNRKEWAICFRLIVEPTHRINNT